ncbi:NADP-dependent oxidoreductase domain-containing protein [Kockovaella imperatae]|uniref:NADP-dependent oxidoreductase domain-containing protein n=1 Tax=Kockovaella imperatae TaxID=4999 RepID=A0A1Y1UPV6_9TREE|nr:NADP-dependent oxidoreductase domain-containing protein [Kockovaella imperatae]ORX40090.1 NADP-dependent oxidoreductase domain-containing protein [Kockovaella imperatae]
MVRTISLSDGKKIPAVGWGNGTQGIQKSGRKAIDLGVLALKAGVLHIDTAQLYGTEKETGEAIKEAGLKPEDVWVTTKISGSKVQNNLESIRENVKESIDLLGFIPNLILIHWPKVVKDGDVAKFWQHLEALVEDGTLKGCSLGFSNFRPQDIEAIMEVAKIKPVCNQLEYHPYVVTHLDPVIKVQEKYNIVTQAYGPLQPIVSHPTGGPIKPILTRIAEKMSKETGKKVDEAAVLYLWTIGKNVVAVTTSGNPENIKKMAATEDLPDLTKEEMEEIEQAGRKVHYRRYDHMNEGYPKVDLPEDI